MVSALFNIPCLCHFQHHVFVQFSRSQTQLEPKRVKTSLRATAHIKPTHSECVCPRYLCWGLTQYILFVFAKHYPIPNNDLLSFNSCNIT